VRWETDARLAIVSNAQDVINRELRVPDAARGHGHFW
jgi:hypothetical protein